MRGFAFLLLLTAGAALGQDAKKEIQKYQQMIAEGSPAELYELEGEALWKKPQGPNSVSLEKCDLGMGPGVLKAAYARLPRYFKDADRVMDLETRLLYCMETLQGRSRKEATQRVFGNDDRASEMEYLSAYIAGASRGVRMAPGASHPKEKEAFELGKKLFFHRAGPWDFSCASCHGEESKRCTCRRRRVRWSPPGRRTAFPTASSRPCSGASTTAIGRCACRSRSSPRMRRLR